MELQLFNSLKNSITKIDLQSGQIIDIYLCGPTVYDHIHLGNLRSPIIFDVLHRLLLSLNIKVNYIQNITDIDDKIILRADKEKKSEQEISNHYAKAYFNNLIRYNVLFPSYSPRVTNYILEIQNFIFSLLEKNAAYEQKNDILFRAEENKDYGKLSGQKLEKLTTSAREISRDSERNNIDFVLWKKTQTGINWDSRWGFGRPGWHTECAVFIDKLFHGQTIDIHGGGNDLLFPHHENERIQYLVKNNKELSKIWLHVAHLYWKEEKMSKSLGNVILAKNFAKNYDPNAFRYLVLNSRYNQVINFSSELIQQATDYVQKIKNLLKKLNFYLYLEKIKVKTITTFKREEVINSLLNNLNTIKVLYFLETIVTFLNQRIDQKETKQQEFHEAVSDFYFILKILGFKFILPSYDYQAKLLINKWQKLRKENNYSQADIIRSELQKIDIV